MQLLHAIRFGEGEVKVVVALAFDSFVDGDRDVKLGKHLLDTLLHVVQYPFPALVGVCLFFWHTFSMTQRVRSSVYFSPRPKASPQYILRSVYCKCVYFLSSRMAPRMNS